MFADGAAAAVFTRGPLSLVLTDAGAVAFFTRSPLLNSLRRLTQTRGPRQMGAKVTEQDTDVNVMSAKTRMLSNLTATHKDPEDADTGISTSRK